MLLTVKQKQNISNLFLLKVMLYTKENTEFDSTHPFFLRGKGGTGIVSELLKEHLSFLLRYPKLLPSFDLSTEAKEGPQLHPASSIFRYKAMILLLYSLKVLMIGRLSRSFRN